ncbi:hypothetical protein [Oceanibacterium hippocampi]|uniref:Uncharacterized protein n=1 Tax=Oceanibacterium hippocampi TaxID=745714 RepID=A0A1Y5TYA3_9PROT|nr:hypothetical protein [Oceanibacterium hippocampi]SLN76833.1 hypothetical protein OCH7691_04206 [Oceanibacterium hippocampi]
MKILRRIIALTRNWRIVPPVGAPPAAAAIVCERWATIVRWIKSNCEIEWAVDLISVPGLWPAAVVLFVGYFVVLLLKNRTLMNRLKPRLTIGANGYGTIIATREKMGGAGRPLVTTTGSAFPATVNKVENIGASKTDHEVVFIRAIVSACGTETVSDCRVYLVALCKISSNGSVEPSALTDPIQLPWYPSNHCAENIHPDLIKYAAVLRIPSHTNIPEIAGDYPLVLSGFFNESAEYELGLHVTGNNASAKATIVVTWAGDTDSLTVKEKGDVAGQGIKPRRSSQTGSNGGVRPGSPFDWR